MFQLAGVSNQYSTSGAPLTLSIRRLMPGIITAMHENHPHKTCTVHIVKCGMKSDRLSACVLGAPPLESKVHRPAAWGVSGAGMHGEERGGLYQS